MKNTIIIGLLLATISVQAQLQITIILPPPSPSVTNLVDNPDLFKAIVTNTTSATVSFKSSGLMKLDGTTVGFLPKEKSDIKEVAPFATNTYNLDDIFSQADAIEYDESFIQTAIQTGFMPAGIYEWCYEFYNADLPGEPVIVPLICRSQYITTFQPPTILYPMDGMNLGANNRPLMRWSPVIPAYTDGPLTYKVQVFKIMEGQDMMQAFRANQPFFERETPALQLMWPFEVPMEAGQYVWTVRAFNEEGKAVGEPETFAEPETFTIPRGTTTNAEPTLPLSAGQGIIMKFAQKDNPSESTYEMVVPFKAVETIQRIFELSDQSENYQLTLAAQLTITPEMDNVGYPIYNAWGDITRFYTAEGTVLTFKNNRNNGGQIGTGNPEVIYPRNGKGTRTTANQSSTKPQLL